MAAKVSSFAVHSLGYPLALLSEIVDGVAGRRKPNFEISLSAVGLQPTLSVSFGPGGFNMAYTGGSLRVIEQNPAVFSRAVFMGSSTGSVIACCACAGVPRDKLAEIMGAFNEGFRQLGRQGFTSLIELLGKVLLEHLPNDAHTTCTGRLVVAFTSLRFGCPGWRTAVGAAVALLLANPIASPIVSGTIAWTCCLLALLVVLAGGVQKNASFVSSFESKKDLVNAILCSCSMPLVQDKYPLRRSSDFTPTSTSCAGSVEWTIDASFSLRHAVLARIEHVGETIAIDWDVKAAAASRDLRTCSGVVRTSTPPVVIHPERQLPSRIVDPPDAAEIAALLDAGARDFETHLVGVGLLLPP